MRLLIQPHGTAAKKLCRGFYVPLRYKWNIGFHLCYPEKFTKRYASSYTLNTWHLNLNWGNWGEFNELTEKPEPIPHPSNGYSSIELDTLTLIVKRLYDKRTNKR